MIDFTPSETPLQVPVQTSFEVRGKGYVVDADGLLFFIDVRSDDPDDWTWQLVQQF
jgi:hypothetical protein